MGLFKPILFDCRPRKYWGTNNWSSRLVKEIYVVARLKERIDLLEFLLNYHMFTNMDLV